MYKAKVVKLQTKPHPNADKLRLGYVNGIQVIVGLDTQDGEIGVFFRCDGQLTDGFLRSNNLYRHSHLNNDSDKKGYFGDNGRVTAEKIRGERSDGFWCPLSYFEYTGYDLSKLQLGNEFDELSGHKICKKYYTKATRKAISGRKAKKTQADYNLPRHYDTEQLQYNLSKVECGDLVIISEKCHGTSTRIGYVQVEREVRLNWLQKLYNKLPLPSYPIVTNNYEFVIGTRNTIASSWVTPESNDYHRLELAEPLRGMLKKGEVIYAEIVGFDSNGKPIMNRQGTSKLPEIQKHYGDVMTYAYSCAWNNVNKLQRKMMVYRITQVNEDGYELDLTWAQIKKRANELGLEIVPELHRGIIDNDKNLILDDYGYKDGDDFDLVIEHSVTGASTLDASHIREGICVRLEKADGTIKVYKHKSFEFKVLEGILKQDDNYVDTEEVN